MRLVWATVRDVVSESTGLQSLNVDLDDGSEGSAYNYPALAGACEPGERVLLNTTAVTLSLGTGGWHFVVARASVSSGTVLDTSSGGHILKLRYSPSQLDVISVESQESPHHAVMQAATGLSGAPVVCCGLHSQIPLVAAAVKESNPHARVVYCMTDQAALALPLSKLTAHCVDVGLIDATISCGQAFGGEYEAINLHSGLLAAVHVCQADVVIVGIGPGVAGTATPFGHGGVAQGEALNAVAALGGTAVACMRVSFADARERHTGVSHHTIAALTTVALASSKVAIPALEPQFFDAIVRQLDEAGVWQRHEAMYATDDYPLDPPMRGVTVTTMGRNAAQDPTFFQAAFAAGKIAFSQSRFVL